MLCSDNVCIRTYLVPANAASALRELGNPPALRSGAAPVPAPKAPSCCNVGPAERGPPTIAPPPEPEPLVVMVGKGPGRNDTGLTATLRSGLPRLPGCPGVEIGVLVVLCDVLALESPAPTAAA